METLKKVFLSVCILFCASNLWADAYGVYIGGIYYNLSYPNATVTWDGSSKYNSYSGKVTIPETVTYGSNTYNVTAIGRYAFSESTGLTSVSLPESITSIGDRAFYNCSGLTSFTIPSKVTTIGDRAFYNCSGLTTITIPKKVSSIGLYAFLGCSDLEEVNFNASACSVTSAVGLGPFNGCSNLLKVNIGDEVSVLPDYLFTECGGLIDITIPNNVTKIGAGAFYKCTGLKSVTIQDGTKDIYYCRDVRSGYDSDMNPTEIPADSFTGCKIETLYVGRNMDYEDTYSPFKENTSLSSLTIGEGVTSINEYDFCDCTNLIEVNFNATKYASKGTSDSSGFLGCTNFSKVNIGDNVTIVPTYLFNDCTSLTEVNFNATACASAGTSDHPAFSGCTSLSRVIIGDNVTMIPENLFKDCTSLTEVNYNATACVSAGSSDYPAFSGCTSPSRVNIGDNVTMVPAYLFKDCTGLEEIAIPENIASIGDWAFSNCTSLAEVRYGASSCTLAGSIDYPIFNECTNLSKIIISDNVSIIPPCLLCGCSSIKGEINIPNGVVEIRENAFGNCSGLKTLTIEDGAETLTMATSASSTPFSGCPIETLYLGRDMSYDDSYSPFRDNISLTSLTIGEKVTTLGEYEFYGCSSLTGVTSLNLVPPMLCSNTFENVINVEVPMSALNTYALADKWVDIPIIYANDGGDVYYPVPIFYEGNMAIVASGGDENGTVATKGGSIEITPIEKNNLIYGLALHDTKDITEELINENYYSFVVSEYHKDNTLYTYSAGDEHSFDVTLSQSGQLLEEITVSKVNDVYYLKVTGDINGTDILTIRRMSNLRILDIEGTNIVKGGECYYSSYETSNNEVGVYFFTDMSSLKQVKLPASAVTIGGYAFNNCSDLMTMAIPSKITSIGSSAFYGCSKLVDITIPNSVTRIYNSAYADCAKLRFVTIEDSDNSLSITTSKNSIDGSVSTPFTGCPIETLYLGRNISYSNDISPFEEISTLKTLTIGNKATTISSCAFENCVGLTELIIGSKVASISNNAFDGCISLAEIDSKNPTPPTITSNTFSGVDKETCVLNVPSGSLNAYWIHVYWGEFFNINEVDFPDGIDKVIVDNDDVQIKGIDGALW